MSTRMQTHTHIRSGPQIQRDAAEFDPLTGMRLTPSDPWLCFAEDDASEDDASADEPSEDDASEEDERKFSAADIEKTIKRRLTKTNREHTKAMKVAAKKATELEAAIAELQEKLEAGTEGDAKKNSAQERELSKAAAKVQALTEQVTALTGERDTASGSLKSYIVRDRLRNALVDAKVLPTALKHAVSLMASEMGAELLDEDGEHVVVVKVKGSETDDLAGAARTWLKSNSHFAIHPGGGTGEHKPRAGNGKRGAPLTPDTIEKSNPSTLIQRGMAAAAEAK